MTEPSTCILPLIASPWALLTRERRGKGRFLASSLSPRIPSSSLLGHHNQPSLGAAGCRPRLYEPSKDDASSKGPTLPLPKSSY